MKRVMATIIAAAALPLLIATAAGAQSSDDELRREIEALKEGQQQILEQLADLKKQLASRAPSRPNVAGKIFDLAANPVKGEPSARLTLIEFTDFQ